MARHGPVRHVLVSTMSESASYNGYKMRPLQLRGDAAFDQLQPSTSGLQEMAADPDAKPPVQAAPGCQRKVWRCWDARSCATSGPCLAWAWLCQRAPTGRVALWHGQAPATANDRVQRRCGPGQPLNTDSRQGPQRPRQLLVREHLLPTPDFTRQLDAVQHQRCAPGQVKDSLGRRLVHHARDVPPAEWLVGARAKELPILFVG
jgi:hypothetical protein